MDLNLKSLIGKLDRTCHAALEGAAGICVSRTNFNVEIEHWVSKLLEDTGNDISRIFRQFEVNPDRVTAGLTRVLDKLKVGNSRAPGFSPNIVAVIKDAWLLSTVEFGNGRIRSGVLLLAMISDPQIGAALRDASRELERIKPEELKSQFIKIVGGSSEDGEMISEPGAMAAPGMPGAAPGLRGVSGKTPNLDQFTINLTAKAKSGKVDPVLGRDNEIRQIVDILMRRRQNNPILTGEAGVGKTAVVEGFAQRVADNDVPPPLQGVQVHTLDLGLLQAGAGVKGEFENRLKGVIEEVKSSPTPIIMFIDEAHTMVGAGGQEGQGDAANLLKPALARGELRTIAATTWAEYKKYFEKDAALARRFQVVKVDEPTEANAVAMMRGIVDMLEKHHKVAILDEAVVSSVHLSARYISGRQLPDKCVSLLDTACARVAIGQSAIPGEVEDTRRHITVLETELKQLKGEEAAGSNHANRIGEIGTALEETKTKLAALEERWKKERDVVVSIRDNRERLKQYSLAQSGAPPAKKKDDKPPVEGIPKTPEEAAAVKEVLERLNVELAELQGEDPLIQPCVDANTIAAVISAWTGVPVGRMMADEIQTILKLGDSLSQMVIGQDHALNAIAKRIQTSRANIVDPGKPIGVFLMVGPSGVGKTETAIALSNLLYGGERNIVTINMSEYQEAHTVSGLKGAPPGYVGYGQGGVLTEAVRRKPYSIVLLDEFEKAHSDVWELFFQVFDKGRLEDGEGREIDFKNTIILATSNVGTDVIASVCADPDTAPDPEALVAAVRPELDKVFPLALLGRLVVCAYYPIAPDVMKKIIRLKLGKIVKRVKENHGVPLTYDDQVVEVVASRCTEAASGARNVDNILTNTLLPEMAREFLTQMAEGNEVPKIHIAIGADGNFSYQFN